MERREWSAVVLGGHLAPRAASNILPRHSSHHVANAFKVALRALAVAAGDGSAPLAALHSQRSIRCAPFAARYFFCAGAGATGGFGFVVISKSSVRNGTTGSPSLLKRLHTGLSDHA